METPACQRAGAPTPIWRLRFLLHSCLVGGGGPPPGPPPPFLRSLARLVDPLVLCAPGHHRAQSGAYHFDAVLGGVAAAGGHARVVQAAFLDEHLGVVAVLDAFEGI